MQRFVITGSGRCGTMHMSQLLTAAGVPCGHERAFNADHAGVWPTGLVADSSWMAAAQMDAVDTPVVLLVRHPLAVVRSWVEIGFFADDLANPTHGPLRKFAPEVYDYTRPCDRALSMWLTLNRAALARAEMVLRLEHLNAAQLARLLGWAGASRRNASAAFGRVGRVNQQNDVREQVGLVHQPIWTVHHPGLAGRARDLTAMLGYDPEVIPGG